MSGSLEYGASDMRLDVIALDEAETFPSLFQQRVARSPDTIAYRPVLCRRQGVEGLYLETDGRISGVLAGGT